MSEDLLVCQCGDVEHCAIISYDPDDKEVYINIHLRRLPLFKRIIVAIKYICGKKSKYGCFEEMIVSRTDWRKFKKIAYTLKPDTDRRFKDKDYNNKPDDDVSI